MVLTTRPCEWETQEVPCSGARTAPQRDCGCRGGCGGHHHTQPFAININNSPFMGSYSTEMTPVVNIPPVIVAPTQQTTYGHASHHTAAPPPPPSVPTVGGGRETMIIEQPIERERTTEIVTRQPQIVREPTRRIERTDPPRFVATTEPREKKPFFAKHFVPTWY